MSALETTAPRAARSDPLDRLCEYANVGAGHAAGALAQLTGVTLRMKAPVVDPPHSDEAGTGIVFEVEGGPGGFLGVFFSAAARDALLEALLGAVPDDPEASGFALAEAGNILASHALSAVAELVGTRVLPKLPRTAAEVSGEHFARLVEGAAGRGAVFRIENEIVDAAGVARGRLVWVPAPI